MSKKYYLCIISLLLSISVVSQIWAVPFNTRILDSGVLRIIVKHNSGRLITGSGFLVNRSGHVLTNYHVIHSIIGSSKVDHYVLGGIKGTRKNRFKLVWYSREQDIALLKVEGLGKQRHPLIIADSEHASITKGLKVWTLGFPGASDTAGLTRFSPEPVLKDGIISVKRNMILVRNATATRMYEHNAVINSGNSGGPLLDNCGRVIGMNQSKALSKLMNAKGRVTVSEGTFWSIRSVELVQRLKKLGVNFHYTADSCKASTVVPGGKSYLEMLEQLDHNKNRWRLITIVLAIVLIIVLGFVIWWKFKTRNTHEGVSQFVRRELSRVLRHRYGVDGKILAGKETENIEPATVYVPKPGIVFGILFGRGALSGKQFSITQNTAVLGRGRQSDFQIKDDRVGRSHMKIGWDETQCNFYIEDMGSVNGTWLSSGNRIEPNSRYYMQAGVEFYIADPELLFVIELPEKPTIPT